MAKEKKKKEEKINCHKCKHFVDVIPWGLFCYITNEELESSRRYFCEDYEEMPERPEGNDGPF